MSRPLPLKKKEGERLEFKGAQILREPDKVARAVVAMLNTRGGEVWIGVREAPGRNEAEPIQDAENARTRLQDSLLDAIEPRLLHDEIELSIEGEDQGGPVLRVGVRPDSRRQPYAVLGPHGARYFWRRFDNRTVPLTREEIGSRFQPAASAKTGAQPPGRRMEPPEILRGERERLLSRGRRFALVLEPDVGGDLIKQRLAQTDYLSDPTCSGTPRSSYNYAHALYHGGMVAEPKKGSLQVGDESFSLSVLGSGGIRFESALDNLHSRGIIDSAGRALFGTLVFPAPNVLVPEALTGYTCSTLRLAALLLSKEDLWDRLPEGPLWAALFLTGLEGWLLPPGLGLSFGWLHEIERHRYGEEVFAEEWLALNLDDVRDRPDACGLRLLRPLYWSFGWMREDDLPAIQSVGLGPPRL